CAVLNSAPVDEFIRSYSAAGRGFGAPSVMQNLALPRFDPAEALHLELSSLSQKAHERVARNADITGIQQEIDLRAMELWNIKS
ncbi:MAG TPA: hypothetical protein VM658_14715, partial [bacterium]|nr:hypothetical protein [bacterium]